MSGSIRLDLSLLTRVSTFTSFLVLLLFPSILTGIPISHNHPVQAYAASQDINMSSNSGVSDIPRVAASGSNVYVAWYDDTPTSGTSQVFFSNSTDSGQSFSSPVQLTNSSSNQVQSIYPLSLAAARAPSNGTTTNNVYIAWTDALEGSPQALFARSTDGGRSFVPIVNLSNDSAVGVAAFPWISAPDDGTGNVFVAWMDNSNTTDHTNFQIFFAKSDDGGRTFTKAIELSNGTTESGFYPQIAVSGNYVYAIWSDQISGDIYGRASTDGGLTFGAEVNISNGAVGSFGNSVNSGSLHFQNVAAVGNNAFVVWNGVSNGETQNQIFMANSTNGGVSFGSPVDLSNDNGIQSGINSPHIASSDADGSVYVVWPDSNGTSTQIFARSVIEGNLTKIVNLSNSTGNADDLSIGVSTLGKAYVVWTDDFDGVPQIYSVEISAAGGSQNQSFNGPAKVSNTSGQSSHAQVATSADKVFVTWSDSSGVDGVQDIFFAANPNYAIPKISITQVSNSAPNWGSQISVSGTTINTAAGESITIEWGNNSNSTGIAVSLSDGKWGPAFHTYDSSAISTNPNNIVAKLINSTNGSVLAQSAQFQISLKKRNAVLVLNPVASVKQGSNIAITGSLADADPNLPALLNRVISFNGTGATSLPQAITTANGSFSSSGLAPIDPGDGWSVQASFEGDQFYNQTSGVTTYDTAPSSARSIPVPAGPNINVNLTTSGFQSYITFDRVSTGGVLYVSDCTASNTTRFIAITGMCVSVAPGLTMAPGTSAHILVSYAGKTLPGSYTAADVDLYEVTKAPSNKIIDITQSRDVVSKTVTGSTDVFSDFVAGVALRSTFPSDAIVEQIFVGNNSVNFRNITAPTISLDKSSYSIGQIATITIMDLNANINSSKIERISADVTSNSSRPAKLRLNLTETAPGTGVFKDQLTFSSGPTSNVTKALHLQTGDMIIVSYTPNPMPSLQALYRNVDESGIVAFRDFTIDQNGSLATTFITIGSAVNMTVEGAQLGPDGYYNVTMSYASDYRGSYNATNVCVFQFQPLAGWTNISYRGASGHDLKEQTAIGRTSVLGGILTLGVLQVGCDLGTGGGGGGGGLALPGAGVVLDFSLTPVIASVSSGGSHKASSSSSSQSLTAQISSGKVVKQEIVGGTSNGQSLGLQVTFENVISSGTLTVNELQPIQLPAGSFKQMTANTQGTVTVDGTSTSGQTVGKVYDLITSSSLSYNGSITVTIPYDTQMVNQSGSSELDIRFLHYTDQGIWQDRTLSINTTSHTVTGQLDSFSPVVAAVVSDGTFGPIYFESHTLSRVADVAIKNNDNSSDKQNTIFSISANNAESIHPGDKITISNTIKNLQRESQQYDYIVEVFDMNNMVIDLMVKSGTFDPGMTQSFSQDWTAREPGVYTVKIFVIQGLNTPIPILLKNSVSTEVSVLTA